jgi:phage terminase large subunit
LSVNLQIPKAFKGLFEPKRYKIFYGGRGGAKSHAFARAILVKGMQQPLRVVCSREIQKSIKDSVHQLLSNIIREHGLDDFYTIQNDAIKGANGTLITFIGLKHNVTGMKSLEGVDILWVEEAENVSSNSWEIAIPTIRKEGSEIWVSFNTKNITDPTYQRFVAQADDRMLVKKVSWRDNPFFSDVLNDERKKLESEDPEAYLHVWEGEPDTRRSGFIYAKQLSKARDEQRITSVPYDPSCEVFTAWDLGFGDATSIWFLQFVGRELRWIDFYENSGQQLDHYVELIKFKPYNYSKHFLPHDGSHGNIRGLRVDEQLKSMGLRCEVLERETNISVGIELVRQTLAYSVLDAEKCKDGIHSLDNYKYEWNEDLQRFKDKPLHDWSSNAADAARYAAHAASKVKTGFAKPKPPPQRPVYTGSQGYLG